MSWLDDLEARLESFLRANPDQEARMAEQERRDRQETLRRQRLQLQQEAELARASLLQLASDIRCWQERVQRARAAGAADLAGRAEAHVAELMDQGRRRWQSLGELGQRFSRVEWELSQLGRQTTAASPAGASSGPGSGESPRDAASAGTGQADLQDAWTAFEAQQDLEALKQRLQR